MNEINFEIINTYREPDTGFIRNVEWVATLPNMPQYLGAPGNMVFIKDPDQPIIPYEQLSKAQIVEWIKQKLGEENLVKLADLLQQKLQASILQQNTGLVQGVPTNHTESVPAN
jgi:hypothetical protein